MGVALFNFYAKVKGFCEKVGVLEGNNASWKDLIQFRMSRNK